MAEYLYGTYGHLAESVVQATAEASTVALYVGTAPVNLIRGYADAGIINTPVKLTNYLDAQSKIGDASDWGKYTLCEAVAAHFNNGDNVGPIYVINVLNPATHRKGAAKTVTLNFVNGKASFTSEDIILDTLAVADKAEGVDYAVSYGFNSHKVTIVSLDSDNPIEGAVAVTYNEIDVSGITVDDIIGAKSNTGVYTGLQAADLIYPNYGAIVNLMAAPGWSQIPAVYRALVTKATKLNGHWDSFVFADIPLSYEVDNYSEVTPDAGSNPHNLGYYEQNDSGKYVLTEDTTVQNDKQYYIKSTSTVNNDTLAKAASWKANNGYTSERSCVYFPMAKGTDGNVYHISTLAMAETLKRDLAHDGVPMESCGNKSVPVSKQAFGSSAGFDANEANDLCSNGIGTVVFWGGSWKLWGDHTAAYTFANTELDPRDIFDVSMRMLLYLTNAFQIRWAGSIDKPMTVQLKDTILTREQERLDALAAAGALIGSPKIVFEEAHNSLGALRNGNFRWDIQVTPTPPLKSASAYVAYTDEGFAAYF